MIIVLIILSILFLAGIFLTVRDEKSDKQPIAKAMSPSHPLLVEYDKAYAHFKM